MVCFVSVNADIDHGCAGLDIFRINHLPFADRNDKDIRTLCHLFQIYRMGMCDCNGSVFCKQQLCDRFTDDIASADHNALFSVDPDIRAL